MHQFLALLGFVDQDPDVWKLASDRINHPPSSNTRRFHNMHRSILVYVLGQKAKSKA